MNELSIVNFQPDLRVIRPNFYAWDNIYYSAYSRDILKSKIICVLGSLSFNTIICSINDIVALWSNILTTDYFMVVSFLFNSILMNVVDVLVDNALKLLSKYIFAMYLSKIVFHDYLTFQFWSFVLNINSKIWMTEKRHQRIVTGGHILSLCLCSKVESKEVQNWSNSNSRWGHWPFTHPRWVSSLSYQTFPLLNTIRSESCATNQVSTEYVVHCFQHKYVFKNRLFH